MNGDEIDSSEDDAAGIQPRNSPPGRCFFSVVRRFDVFFLLTPELSNTSTPGDGIWIPMRMPIDVTNCPKCTGPMY